MGSISGRFSGLGSAINNSISRVGQPLLGALIFIAISATYYASLGSTAGLDTGDPRRPGRVPAAQSTRAPARPPSRSPPRTRPRSRPSTWRCWCAPGCWRRRAGRLVRPARRCGRRGDVRRTCRAGRMTPPMTDAGDDARLGRPDVRPRRRPDDALGHGRPRAPPARRRRTGARCRVRQRARHRAARRAPAARARGRPRRLAVDGRGGARAAGARSATGSNTSSPTSGEPLPIDGPVDAILSTATFHWVPDHDALFRNLAAVPAARAAGSSRNAAAYGNIASVQRVLATIGDGWLGPAHYETPMATVRRLDAAGFVDIECWLTDEPTRFEPGEPLETYLRTVDPRRPPGAAPAGGARRLRARGGVTAARAADRLRPAQHRGATLAAADRSGSRTPERRSVARDDDVGRRQDARPAALDRGLVVAASGSISGVRSARHHRWVIA